LANISHGAHFIDYFLALKVYPEVSGWHGEPIMFVYENPNLDYDIYKDLAYKGYHKRPSKDWYWIHEDQESVIYPERFWGGEYGGFVSSVIMTFKLFNVYIPNHVKCCMNNPEGKFKVSVPNMKIPSLSITQNYLKKNSKS
jgi:hypothetical protein